MQGRVEAGMNAGLSPVECAHSMRREAVCG